MRKMTKATRFEVLKRVNKIYLFIIKGKSDDYIIQYSSKYWKISERQLATYMKRAVEKFEKKADIKNEIELGKQVAQQDDLYDQNYQMKNYTECRQILRDKAELLGLKKLDKSLGDKENPINVEFVVKKMKE